MTVARSRGSGVDDRNRDPHLRRDGGSLGFFTFLACTADNLKTTRQTTT